MCIIVIAVGIVAPVADSMHQSEPGVGRQSTRSAASVADAHGRAMEEGRPYRFSVQDGSGHFRVEPDDADAVGADAGIMREGDMPDPCIFGQCGRRHRGRRSERHELADGPVGKLAGRGGVLAGRDGPDGRDADFRSARPAVGDVDLAGADGVGQPDRLRGPAPTRRHASQNTAGQGGATP